MVRFVSATSARFTIFRHGTASWPSILKYPLPSMTKSVRRFMVTVLVSKMSAASSIVTLFAKAAVSSASVVTMVVVRLRRVTIMELGSGSRKEEDEEEKDEDEKKEGGSSDDANNEDVESGSPSARGVFCGCILIEVEVIVAADGVKGATCWSAAVTGMNIK